MSSWLSAEHAGAGCAGAAQSLAAGFLLLFQTLVQEQPPQEDQVSDEAREGTSPGHRAHTSTNTCLTDVKVSLYIFALYLSNFIN